VSTPNNQIGIDKLMATDIANEAPAWYRLSAKARIERTAVSPGQGFNTNKVNKSR
jgi:hypothetical protein